MRALTNGKRIAKTRQAVDYELYGALGSAKYKMHKAAGTNRVAAIRCDVGDVEAYVQRAEALARKHGRKIEARSYILSFKTPPGIDPRDPAWVERVADLSYGWAKEMGPDSDVLVIVHTDGHGNHTHGHIKILNHNNVTEKAVRGIDLHRQFSKIADAYLAAEAPDLPDQPRQHEGDQASYWEQMRDGASVSEFDRWLGDTIEEVLADPSIVDEDSYRAALAAKGIELIAETHVIKASADGTTPEHESIGWTYRAIDTFGEKQRKRRRKASTFGTAATHDGAHEVFADNAARAKAAQQAQAPATPVLPPQLAAIFADGDDEIDQTIRAFRLAHGLDVEPVRAADDVEGAVESKDPVAAPAAPVADQPRDAAPAAPEPVEPSAAPAASAVPTAPPGAATQATGPSTVQEAEEDVVYVSRLRTLRGKIEAAQALIDEMVAFDEDCHARLAQGLRPVEEDVPAGYGPKTHARFRDYLADDVVAQLDLRFAKKDARREAFETGRDLAAEVKAMRADGKHWTDEFEAKVRQRDAANARRKRLEAELAAGVYEPVVVGSVTTRPAPAALWPTPGQQRDDTQLG